MRRSHVSISTIALAFLLSAIAMFSSAKAQFPYCAAPCTPFDYPSTWEGCADLTCGTWCSPVVVEIVTPCGNFPHAITPAHRATCDAAWCQSMQENFDSYVGCIETHIWGVPEYPECCHGTRVILCSELEDCLADFNLANSIANAVWFACMSTWTSMIDPTLDEAIIAYLT